MQKPKKLSLFGRFLQFIKSLLITIFAVFSWCVLMFTCISVLNWANTEHYQPDDVPNERFDVLSIEEHEKQLDKRKWQTVNDKPKMRVKNTDDNCNRVNCLITQDDGSFIFYNEGALWDSQSRYRIEGNKLIPISFLFFSIGTVFNAMILASLLYAMGKYTIKRWLYRHSVEKTQVYNQQVLKQLKTFLICCGAVIGFCLVMSLFNK